MLRIIETRPKVRPQKNVRQEKEIAKNIGKSVYINDLKQAKIVPISSILLG